MLNNIVRYVIIRKIKLVCGNIQKFPGLGGFLSNAGFQIPRQDSRFHLGFQTTCTRFQLVTDPPGLPSDGITKLSQFQEFVCVLVKLRTNAANEDLCYRSNISPATVSRILLKCLKRMDIRLQELIF